VGQPPRRPDRVGHGDADNPARRFKVLRYLPPQRLLAAETAGTGADVEKETLRTRTVLQADDGTEAPGPFREPFQGVSVCRNVGVENEKTALDRLGLRHRHSGAHAGPRREP
jgi:hypothetical protein